MSVYLKISYVSSGQNGFMLSVTIEGGAAVVQTQTVAAGRVRSMSYVYHREISIRAEHG